MAAPMTYLGLISGFADGAQPRLQVATPSGLVREIPLARKDLLQIIRSAVGAIEHLDRQGVAQ